MQAGDVIQLGGRHFRLWQCRPGVEVASEELVGFSDTAHALGTHIPVIAELRDVGVAEAAPEIEEAGEDD